MKKHISAIMVILLVLFVFQNTIGVFAEGQAMDTANDTTEYSQEGQSSENDDTEYSQEQEIISSEKNEEDMQTTDGVEELAEVKIAETQAYASSVVLPAPINEAFPTPIIASAIATAVYSNSSAVTNTVTQSQLNSISTLSIGSFSGTLDLSELTAYGGFANLQTLTISGYGVASFPDNFNSTQFPKINSLSLNNIYNTSLPDFQFTTLTYLSVYYLNRLVSLPNFTGLPALTSLNVNYGSSLVDVPDFAHLPNLKSLSLTSLSSLKEIPDFQYLPQLVTLQTEYTYLTTALNFSHLPNLTSLNHSSLGELPDYDHLPNLTRLSVMSGGFSVLPDFHYLPNLNYTYLWTSSPTLTVPNFSNLPLMETMTIRGLNDGTTISPTNTLPDFSHMPLMKTLTITGYAITSVPNFQYMPVMNALTISLTKLGAIPDFSHMPIIKTLLVTDNLVTSVPNFQYMPDLETLAIYNTLITQVPDFDNFLNLGTLNLSNNKLTSIPNWNLPKLVTLYVNNNALTQVPTLDTMQNLQVVSFAYNKLETIPNLSLPKLTSLSLNNNTIKSLPAMDQLPKMTVFTVGSNALTELPTRVLSFAVSNLLPQSFTVAKTVEIGSDFTTDIPIVDQVSSKVSGFKVLSSTIDGKTVSIGPAASAMLVPTSTLKEGAHTVIISMGSTSGTTTITATYKITVVDTTAPVISADSEITYEAGDALPSETAFLSAVNASAVDAVDGTVPISVDLSSIQMNVVGDYTVTLRAMDTSGNVATKDVIVSIVDTTPPVILADDEITYEAGSAVPSESVFLTMVNATAVDAVDGIVPVSANLSSLSMNVVGNYLVTLSATDAAGNEATKDVIVRVLDTTIPVITADDEITYEVGSMLPSEATFLLDVNASAMDVVGGEVPISVDLSSVEMNVVGSYTVMLHAIDAVGNEATKEVVIHIVDTVDSVITADSEITYKIGTKKMESDFLADIHAQTNDASSITSDFASVVNMDKLGTYVVTLSVVSKDDSNTFALTSEAKAGVKQVTVHIVSKDDYNSKKNSVATGVMDPLINYQWMALSFIVMIGMFVLRQRKSR